MLYASSQEKKLTSLKYSENSNVPLYLYFKFYLIINSGEADNDLPISLHKYIIDSIEIQNSTELCVPKNHHVNEMPSLVQ